MSADVSKPCCKSNQGAGVSSTDETRRRSSSSLRKCLRPENSDLIRESCGNDVVPVSAAASGDGSQRTEICVLTCPHERHSSSPPSNTNTASFMIKVTKTWNDACDFWRQVREDRFRWGLFKSILFFTVGLKLFNDLARHLERPPNRCGR
ncbi:hypothetical protein evm_007892 [Chilo suppressalis]|nr:hypothetical protein evm_007892 [Chilo suppressalis]